MLTNLVIKLCLAREQKVRKFHAHRIPPASRDTSERLIQFNGELASILQHPIYFAIGTTALEAVLFAVFSNSLSEMGNQQIFQLLKVSAGLIFQQTTNPRRLMAFHEIQLLDNDQVGRAVAVWHWKCGMGCTLPYVWQWCRFWFLYYSQPLINETAAAQIARLSGRYATVVPNTNLR